MNERVLGSPLSDMVSVDARVVLSRAEATPRELAELREIQIYEPGSEHAVCELHAGGVCIATGKLVRKGGTWYLQIEETEEAE